MLVSFFLSFMSNNSSARWGFMQISSSFLSYEGLKLLSKFIRFLFFAAFLGDVCKFGKRQDGVIWDSTLGFFW